MPIVSNNDSDSWMFSMIAASSPLSNPLMSTLSMVPRAWATDVAQSERTISGRAYFVGCMRHSIPTEGDDAKCITCFGIGC
ncbi:hypothetical protein D9M71_805570 [compost metagenome]